MLIPAIISASKNNAHIMIYPCYARHHHGGQLKQASKHYRILLSDWIDLSTGISPFTYPLPPVPAECWQRLPEFSDGLLEAADHYYGSPYLLPVSGSQEAIQRLPSLFPARQRVGIIQPAYHSHQQAWEKAGHTLISLTSSEVETQLAELDCLLLVNPTNPSTESFSTETLQRWHQQLQQHQGCLIIDEAFMDTTSESSMIQHTPQPGLIVLRSIGKFFGLAGIRLGFVWAEERYLQQLADTQDDWSVSHPARWAGMLALQDKEWQRQQRRRLLQDSERLQKLLMQSFQVTVNSTSLFSYFQHQQAEGIYQKLAQKGILVRLFKQPLALRFGLPANEEQWLRFEEALKNSYLQN